MYMCGDDDDFTTREEFKLNNQITLTMQFASCSFPSFGLTKGAI